MQAIVTHDGVFHADELFAIAFLRLLGVTCPVIRTRDVERYQNDQDVILIDVGMGQFDHHQKGGNGIRTNGIAYASFGLVFHAFRDRFIATLKRDFPNLNDEDAAQVFDAIEQRMVQPIDASDTGYAMFREDAVAFPITINSMISHFCPINGRKEDYDRAFTVALDFTAKMLREATYRMASSPHIASTPSVPDTREEGELYARALLAGFGIDEAKADEILRSLQNEGKIRPNGIALSPVGETFDRMKEEFLKKVAKNWNSADAQWVLRQIEESIVVPLDAGLQGYDAYNENIAVRALTIHDLFRWCDRNTVFSFLCAFIQNKLSSAREKVRLNAVINDAIAQWDGDPFTPIIMSAFVPGWQSRLTKTTALFVIFPDISRGWRVQAIPVSETSRDSRALFPASWRGLPQDDLRSVSECEDAIFVHPAGFIAGTETLEGAKRMALAALLIHQQELDRTKAKTMQR